MGRILDAALAYFQKRDTAVMSIDEDTVSTPVTGSTETWSAFIAAREDEHQLMIHSVLPEDVPKNRRNEMALFLTRANWGMVIGAFEMDLDDGELRFKTAIDVEGSELDDALIDNLLQANVSMMERYLPGIREVIDGRRADVAIADIES